MMSRSGISASVLSSRQSCKSSDAAFNGCSFPLYQGDLERRRLRQWPRLSVTTASGSREEVAVRPDGYFVLESPQGRAHFFLECDRSTESIARRWQRKILGYKEFVLSGEFNRRYGIAGSAVPLRILTVTPSLARAQNLMRAAEAYGSSELTSMFLCTPLPSCSPLMRSAPLCGCGPDFPTARASCRDKHHKTQRQRSPKLAWINVHV
jgi:hypothetical protein